MSRLPLSDMRKMNFYQNIKNIDQSFLHTCPFFVRFAEKNFPLIAYCMQIAALICQFYSRGVVLTAWKYLLLLRIPSLPLESHKQS